MQCSCGQTIRNPSYTSKSKYDYICNSCKGYSDEEYEVSSITGEEFMQEELDKYTQEELEYENG